MRKFRLGEVLLINGSWLLTVSIIIILWNVTHSLFFVCGVTTVILTVLVGCFCSYNMFKKLSDEENLKEW